jgi:hypothetical protein
MDPLVLTDKSAIPTNDLIFSIIGDKSALWQKLMQDVHTKYPDVQELWNYYSDGKNWLFRMIRKKKTLFWIGILQDTFRITFYFGDKAEPVIEKSDLPKAMREGFKTSKRFGKIRGISIRVESKIDIDNTLKLVAIKIKI